MNKIIITSSWDDGHKLDLKLGELLSKYGIRGTFYIPKKYTKEPLTEAQIIELSNYHEIGAHTLTHPELDKINIVDTRREILGSKEYLESILGKNVKMFCYPRGKYNEEIKNLVKNAGFIGARSTRKFIFDLSQDNFELNVSTHVYPFPLRKKNDRRFLLNKHLFDPFIEKYSQVIKLGLPLNSFFSWGNLVKNCFDYTLKNGRIFHLYGHSHEIERYGMWSELENILKYIASRPDILYLTNGEILEYIEKNKN